MRSRIHAQVIKYQINVVFEHKISTFETAGNRVKIVYAIVKMTDTYSEGGASEQVKNNSWVKPLKIISSEFPANGMSIGATTISQFCSKCRRWYLLDLDKYFDNLNDRKGKKKGDAKITPLSIKNFNSLYTIEMDTIECNPKLLCQVSSKELEDGVLFIAEARRVVKRAMRLPLITDENLVSENFQFRGLMDVNTSTK